jgi:hypothetical protein
MQAALEICSRETQNVAGEWVKCGVVRLKTAVC